MVGQAMGPSLMPAPAFAPNWRWEKCRRCCSMASVVPSRLQELGFEFDFATLDAALKDLLK